MIEGVHRHLAATVLWTAVAGMAVLASDADGQAAPALANGQFRVVDSLVATEFAKDSIGSITVGVIAGSQLVWTRSYGFADMKSRRPADRNTVYRIGSITKPFTAVMLMQLVEAGTVRLSDPVERFLPEVRELRAMPPGAGPFTFLQLATMTAGLSREPSEGERFWTGPASEWEKQMLAALSHTSYVSVPGTGYSYSNIGYAILGGALARAAGQPYIAWQQSRVLTPLGMDRTRFDVDSSIAHDLAVGYVVNGDGTIDDRTAAQEIRDGRGYKVPNGAIFTTVDDLARFVAFELGRGPRTVLQRETLDDAFGGFVASGPDLEQGYGLGFMAMRRDAYSYMGHNGSVAGYRASMYFDRQMQRGVVLFRNVTGGRQDPDRLAVDILSSLAEARRAEIQAGIDVRFKDQRASPGSEAALRRIIDELQHGRPNYDLMNPILARQVRQQLADERTALVALGALTSLTFKGVGRAGPSIYQATFEKGSLEWRIWLNPEGHVDFFAHRPIAAPK
jgi:CubicO group peptidase (beta-lactamase class C family)